MLTKKGKYGLKAMVHLAGRPVGEATLVNDIANANEIPKKFLDTILGELRNAGFVFSKKGKGGGYTLARPAHEIKIGHIVRVLDGPLAPILRQQKFLSALRGLSRRKALLCAPRSCSKPATRSRPCSTTGRWRKCARWPVRRRKSDVLHLKIKVRPGRQARRALSCAEALAVRC